MSVVVAVIGAAVLATIIEFQRTLLRDTYLHLHEFLRGFGKTPSWREIVARVFLLPALLGLATGLLKVQQPLIVGFAIGALGNALVVWHGLFEPPQALKSPQWPAYRMLLIGFMALTGLSGLSGAWIGISLVCPGVATCTVSVLLGSWIGEILLSIVANVLAHPLIVAMYRLRK
jgi:hypothetical protein